MLLFQTIRLQIFQPVLIFERIKYLIENEKKMLQPKWAIFWLILEMSINQKKIPVKVVIFLQCMA